MTKNWKRFTAEKNQIFFRKSKIAIYSPIPSLKRTSKLPIEEAFSPQKRTSSTSKHEISNFFFYFCGYFLPYWMRIRIRIHWPDWIRIRIRIRNTERNQRKASKSSIPPIPFYRLIIYGIHTTITSRMSITKVPPYPVFRNRNFFYGPGSDFWQVTVLVPVPTFDNLRLRFRLCI